MESKTAKTRTCHACGGEVRAKGPTPANGLSTCGPCRKGGADPRDVEKFRLFELWVKDCVTVDPEGHDLASDVWGAYLSYVIRRDADWYFGRPRFLELLEQRGLGRPAGRSRWTGISYVVR